MAALSAHAAEMWHFLPNYHHDVRGIEQPPDGVERFCDILPEAARPLLRPGALGKHWETWKTADSRFEKQRRDCKFLTG